MKTKRRNWRWVTRDENSLYVHIWSSYRKPILVNGCWPTGGQVYVNISNNDHVRVCCKQFEKLFGISLKYKECTKIYFTASF